MTSPTDVVAFHAEFDRHPDDRVRLFGAVAEVVGRSTRVLYPGSYVDLAPSVWFDDVTYLDQDKRAARFFGEHQAVADLIAAKRAEHGVSGPTSPFDFAHQDYSAPLPVEDGSVGLLVSLYAGFISEHCTGALAVGGTLLVNPSHGDAALASIDPRYRLSGAVLVGDGDYRIDTAELDRFLIPKKPQEVTRDSLHASGRGIAYTRSPFAYLFTRVR